MKKLLGLCLAVVFFASCEKEESSKQSKLFGRWYNVSTIENGVTTPYPHKECAKDYIDFNSSNVYRSYKVVECNGAEASVVEREAGTYSKEGKIVTISIEGESDRTITVNSIENSILTITETIHGKDVISTYTSVP